MLADVSLASSHCSAALTVTLNCVCSSRIHTYVHFGEHAGKWRDTSIPIPHRTTCQHLSSWCHKDLKQSSFMVPSIGAPVFRSYCGRLLGSVLLAGWLCLCQLTCYCPPTVHLKPHQTSRRTLCRLKTAGCVWEVWLQNWWKKESLVTYTRGAKINVL